MNQTPKRRPKPITQRDGTKLANANCRMASAATGLDFHTVGAKTSTGGKMRTYTTDQTGGTGSDDAREAWRRGYAQDLVTKDGNPWSSVLVALREGRGVHLDVWHALLTSGCVSGEGRYGHTIYVHPDRTSSGWLVSDPWCLPAAWKRVSESQLKSAAETWGSKVRSATGGSTDPKLLRAAAKALMKRHYPGHEDPDPTVEDIDDTGGPIPVMFTVTSRQPLVTQEEPNLLDKLDGTPGMFRTMDPGTPYFNKPGDKTPAGTINSPNVVFAIAAKHTDSAGKVWFLINSGHGNNMNWVRDADMA